MDEFHKQQIAVHVWGILDGLSRGFTDFFRTSVRVAALYAVEPDGPVLVYDPQQLLADHKDILSRYITKETSWRGETITWRGGKMLSTLEIDGLCCLAFQGRNVPFQLWIAESPSNGRWGSIMRSWISQAIQAWEVETSDSKDIALNQSVRYMLRSGARKAVEDAIRSVYREELGKDCNLRIDWIINLLIVLTRTSEENKRLNGYMAFEMMPEDLYVTLKKPVQLHSSKHIGKLLALTNHDTYLLADDKQVYGYRRGIPSNALIAVLWNGICAISVGNHSVGEIDRGFFGASEFLPHLSEIQRLLGGAKELHFSVQDVMLNARKNRKGASILVDLAHRPCNRGGNLLSEPLSHYAAHFFLEGMSSIDGAIHLNSDGAVISFGCILDGVHQPDLEDPSRGSRFNSAVRFTKANPESVVVVVSEDGPISFLRNGIDLLSVPVMPEMEQIEIQPPEFSQWHDQQSNELP